MYSRSAPSGSCAINDQLRADFRSGGEANDEGVDVLIKKKRFQRSVFPNMYINIMMCGRANILMYIKYIIKGQQNSRTLIFINL